MLSYYIPVPSLLSARPISTRAATGTLESDYGELKKKLDIACEKANEILDMFNADAGSDAVSAMSQARNEVEGLIPILTMEPYGMGQVQPDAVEEVETQAMEEVPPEEEAGQTEAQGEERGQEVVEGEQAQPQPQTEAEAMQEAAEE